MFREVSFHSLCQFAASQHDAPSATFAFQSNICAEADHRPFKGTAWMLFAQTQVVIQVEIG